MKAVLSTLLILSSLILIGCAEQDGPVERAGESVDEGIGNSSDAISDTIEDAGDEIEDATDGY